METIGGTRDSLADDMRLLREDIRGMRSDIASLYAWAGKIGFGVVLPLAAAVAALIVAVIT